MLSNAANDVYRRNVRGGLGAGSLGSRQQMGQYRQMMVAPNVYRLNQQRSLNYRPGMSAFTGLSQLGIGPQLPTMTPQPMRDLYLALSRGMGTTASPMFTHYMRG